MCKSLDFFYVSMDPTIFSTNVLKQKARILRYVDPREHKSLDARWYLSAGNEIGITPARIVIVSDPRGDRIHSSQDSQMISKAAGDEAGITSPRILRSGRRLAVEGKLFSSRASEQDSRFRWKSWTSTRILPQGKERRGAKDFRGGGAVARIDSCPRISPTLCVKGLPLPSN